MSKAMNKTAPITKKRKTTQKKITQRLPKYLVMHPAKGYEFIKFKRIKGSAEDRKDLDFLQSIVGGNISMLPMKDFLQKSGCKMYANECGMMESLPMNNFTYPFMPKNSYLYHASLGGPYGTVVLVNPRGHPYKRMVNDFPFEKSRDVTRDWIEEDEEEEREFLQEYMDHMNKAVETWVNK